MQTQPAFTWFSSDGRITLDLNEEQAAQGFHPGPCDRDITALRNDPAIAEQLKTLDADMVRNCLQDYGAWDDKDLQDNEENLHRLLWIACGDIFDDPESYAA